MRDYGKIDELWEEVAEMRAAINVQSNKPERHGQAREAHIPRNVSGSTSCTICTPTSVFRRRWRNFVK